MRNFILNVGRWNRVYFIIKSCLQLYGLVVGLLLLLLLLLLILSKNKIIFVPLNKIRVVVVVWKNEIFNIIE